MTREDRFLIKWKKIKNEGLKHYIIKTGIFFYGIIFF